MPTISMFYGIVICMYFFDDERHKLPHIHAKYQDYNASFSIADGALLGGDLPVAKSRLVQAWIEIHRESLLADWILAINGEKLFPIDPLR
ncbi:hypothetical protein A1353_05465 [Methylomonas methanica]|uniref:DUF4160 domain-containing protein n=1 Tax=Methylomonas methanica TaxID=421 RepID=A0A177MU36_METMH|nr:DUF4160 domain-containing protein [Methylomonas methanica]OAI09015.1 hypothetical protein A1353_05465 [Methylomonas methanica]